MEERRKAKRISLFLEIKEGNQAPGGKPYLLNISESGAKIQTSTKYDVGDPIEFSFVLPGMKKEIVRQGQVIWVLPHPEEPKVLLVGLEFTTHWEMGRRTN